MSEDASDPLENLSIFSILLHLGIRLVKLVTVDLFGIIPPAFYSFVCFPILIACLPIFWQFFWNDLSSDDDDKGVKIEVCPNCFTSNKTEKVEAVGCVVRKTQCTIPSDSIFQENNNSSKLSKIFKAILRELLNLPQQHDTQTVGTMQVEKVFLIFSADKSGPNEDGLLYHMKYVDLDFNRAWNTPKELYTKNTDINLRFFPALNQ